MSARARQAAGPFPPISMVFLAKTGIEADFAKHIRYGHCGDTFAIYRSPDDKYYATDGLGTHVKNNLADGRVMDSIIECRKDTGRFDDRIGEAKGAPVCIDLKTYPMETERGKVLIDVR